MPTQLRSTRPKTETKITIYIHAFKESTIYCLCSLTTQKLTFQYQIGRTKIVIVLTKFNHLTIYRTCDVRDINLNKVYGRLISSRCRHTCKIVHLHNKSVKQQSFLLSKVHNQNVYSSVGFHVES